MNKRHLQRTVLLSFLTLILIGCSTKITLTSKPEGANLTIGKTNISGATPISSSIRRTTFGKYWFRVEKPGYEPMYGLLPLNVSGAAIALDALFFAPATFWNAQRAFPYYQFDLEKRIIGYKEDSDEPWREYPIKEQEKLAARSFFVAPKQEGTIVAEVQSVNTIDVSTGNATPARQPDSAKADKAEVKVLSDARGVPASGVATTAQPVQDRRVEAFEWFAKAQKYRQSGELENAIEACSKAIQLDPTAVAFYSERGLAYYGSSQHQKAVNDFSIALELKPDNADVLWQRSEALGKMGELQKALADIKAAAKLGQREASEFLKANGIESDS